MKCSESTTILCTCSATRQNARMQQVRANIIGVDNTIMLSLAISRGHDLEIQLTRLLLDDFDTAATSSSHARRVTFLNNFGILFGFSLLSLSRSPRSRSCRLVRSFRCVCENRLESPSFVVARQTHALIRSKLNDNDKIYPVETYVVMLCILGRQLPVPGPEVIIQAHPVQAPCFPGPFRVASAIFPAPVWFSRGRRTRAGNLAAA